MIKMGLIYKDSGVNTKLGNDVSKILYNAAKQTWENRKGKLGEIIIPHDDFSGVRAIDVSNLPIGTLMGMNSDGIGTKIEIAERINDHSTSAHNLFAMVCDDAVIRGAEPVLLASVLDVNSLGNEKVSYIEQVRQLAVGYINAAKEANVAVINGETAELGHRVNGFGDFNYNWSGSVIWFAKKDRLFTGYEIKINDYLVGLREHGFRSNGFSLLRKIMKQNYGDNWHACNLHGKKETLGEIVLTPSKIYAKFIVDLTGGYDKEEKAKIHGIAHITGGGIPEKLGRILKPSGLGAIIDNAFEPSELMLHTQELGEITDREAYKTWNMGQGMIIITPQPEIIISHAKDYGIEAKCMGNITSKPKIKIKSMGIFSDKKRPLIF